MPEVIQNMSGDFSRALDALLPGLFWRRPFFGALCLSDLKILRTGSDPERGETQNRSPSL